MACQSFFSVLVHRVEKRTLGSHTFANNRAIAFRANEAQPTVVVPFAVGKSLMFKEAASEWIVARLADKALQMMRRW